jgi:hypothetical protein
MRCHRAEGIEVSDTGTVARPADGECAGQADAPSWTSSPQRGSHLWNAGIERLLEIAPFLTTVLLLLVYPLLRYLLRDPFPAEVFRFGFISFWIGFLIVNMVRAQKTRQAILHAMEVDWLGRLRALLANAMPPLTVLLPAQLILYQRPPRRWRRGRKFLEWFRLVFTPVKAYHGPDRAVGPDRV